MPSQRCSLHAVVLFLPLLRILADSQDLVKVGESIFLRVKLTGACISVEEFNGEARSHSVHAQFWHHGLWQELKLDKDGGKDGDAVESGDSIRLRGHNGKWIEVVGSEVKAESSKTPSEGLVIEKETGGGPVRIGDTVFLRGSSGNYIGVQNMDASATSNIKGVQQAFIVDTHEEGPFDGRWTEEDSPGEEIYVIKGSALHFVEDVEFGLFPQGNNKFTTGLRGWNPHDAGELEDDKIVWSNGDVWVRTDGPFHGRWTDSKDPGKTIFHLEGGRLRAVGGLESKIEKLSETKFSTDEPLAPATTAEVVGGQLRWDNGDIWVLLAAGRFDGRWTVKVNPGGDFFDIEGDMLFFDPGLETRIYLDGNSFTTELQGATMHVKATLSDDGQELHWSNGDVWLRLHKDKRDFWVPASMLARTGSSTTVTVTVTVTSTVASTVASTVVSTVVSTVASTATAAPDTTTEDLGNQRAAEPNCHEESVVYEPLDMDNVTVSFEASADACQERCRRTKGCVHFTYWHLATPGHCHLQDMTALKSVFRLGFVAGPPHCYETVNSSKHGLVKLDQGDVGPKTYVPYAYRCLKMSRMYSPITHSEFMSKKKGYATGKQAVKGCRELCMKTEGCFYYSVGFPLRLCSLSPKSAHEVKYIIKHVAGPKNCSVEDPPEEAVVSAEQDASPERLGSRLKPEWVQEWVQEALDRTNHTIDLFLREQDRQEEADDTALGRHPAFGSALAVVAAVGVAAVAGLTAIRHRSRESSRQRRCIAPAFVDIEERRRLEPEEQAGFLLPHGAR